MYPGGAPQFECESAVSQVCMCVCMQNVVRVVPSLEPGSPPALYRIKNKKGESLEDIDHVLDMVGHGWAWFDHSLPNQIPLT